MTAQRAKESNQCRHLCAEKDAYDVWYLYCECGETANEVRCQMGLLICDFFEGLLL